MPRLSRSLPGMNSRMNSIFSSASLAAVVYLGLAPRLNKLLYRPMLFFPTRFPSDWGGNPVLHDIEGEDMFFQGKMGQRLHGWYFKNPGSRFTMLISHGNSGNITIRDKLADIGLSSGCSVFVYDYQGFGQSTGKPSVEGICDDAEAAYDCLTGELSVSSSDIVFYGESLGAAVSTYLSTVRDCSAIILQSGFASLKRIAGEHFPFLNIYPPSLFPKPALDSLSILKQEHPPLLLIHGSRDRVIGVEHSETMFAEAVSRKKFLRLPETAHADIWDTARNEVVTAIKEHLGSLD